MISLSKLRPLSGRSFISVSLTSPETDVVEVFTVGASPDTVIVSFTSLGASVKFAPLLPAQSSHIDAAHRL